MNVEMDIRLDVTDSIALQVPVLKFVWSLLVSVDGLLYML
jgi:hypothetical protein